MSACPSSRCDLNDYIPYVIRRKAPVKKIWVDPRRDELILRPLIRHRIKFNEELATRIVREEAAKAGVDPELVVSRSRYWPAVWVRQDAIWRIYNEMEVSYPRLGLFFGMHHTTVLHSINRALSRWLIKQTIYDLLENRHHVPKPSADRPDIDRIVDSVVRRDTNRRARYEKRKQVTNAICPPDEPLLRKRSIWPVVRHSEE